MFRVRIHKQTFSRLAFVVSHLWGWECLHFHVIVVLFFETLFSVILVVVVVPMVVMIVSREDDVSVGGGGGVTGSEQDGHEVVCPRDVALVWGRPPVRGFVLEQVSRRHNWP